MFVRGSVDRWQGRTCIQIVRGGENVGHHSYGY